MVSSKSLDTYIGVITKRYSSLFTLSSRRKGVFLLCALCIFSGILTIAPLSLSYRGVALGLAFGTTSFLLAISSDLIITHTLIKEDPVFNLRRCLFLSLFSNLLWFGVTFLGNIISHLSGNPSFWIRFFLLGFSGAFILRLLVFRAASSVTRGRATISALLQPTLLIGLGLCTHSIIEYDLKLVPVFFLLSVPAAWLSVTLFILLLNRNGLGDIQQQPLSLFKAFVANWTENLNEPLESFLEKLSVETDISLSLLGFRCDQKIKAVVVVPECHPGPFRNVGSSLLPYMIQSTLEDRLQCVASVPHGLLGHDLDLASQFQSRRVVDSVLSSIGFSDFHSEATPFIRTKEEGATASCQILGDCTLITLTLAPRTMEDLPSNLASFIIRKVENQKLPPALLIDAHNSINGPFKLGEAIQPLRKAAALSLEAAFSSKRSSFKMGAAKVTPTEFGVHEGMGPGGISAIVIEVGEQRAAYITIDGNNMISGLREKILAMLRGIGIADGEVLTTDTHAVTGIIPAARGYYPVGEVIDHAKLTNYVREVTLEAAANLRPSHASMRRAAATGIGVIGEKTIKKLSIMVDSTMKRARRLALCLFSGIAILMISLVAFL